MIVKKSSHACGRVEAVEGAGDGGGVLAEGVGEADQSPGTAAGVLLAL
jgi:hypothetical protein